MLNYVHQLVATWLEYLKSVAMSAVRVNQNSKSVDQTAKQRTEAPYKTEGTADLGFNGFIIIKYPHS